MGRNLLLERKITLFLCRKLRCWLTPASCIKRQSAKDIEETVFCIGCSQGLAIKLLEETQTIFKTKGVCNGRREEKKEGG